MNPQMSFNKVRLTGGQHDEYEGAFTDIDGIVAAIMPLDRCIRHEGESGSVYDERGSLVF